MELVIVLLVGLLIAIIVMPFVAMAKASAAQRHANDLSRQIDALERRINQLAAAPLVSKQEPATQVQPAAEPAKAPVEHHQPAWTPLPQTPKPEPAAMPTPSQPREYVFEKARPVAHIPPPPPHPPISMPVSTMPSPEPHKPVNWEQFMGAKLFAWIGGLALFLGVAFFIKYSFDKNLIPPEMRATIGFLTGIGLLAGGLVMKRKETAVTSQTLCSTGILVLYGVTFACRSFYNFPFFQVVPTFLLMTLITTVAFLLAVRMNALAVAVLGIAGGFLTPVLLSTGQDAPLALFGYIALLDIGLLAVALRQRWNALPVLGAIGTIVMQVSWLGGFFVQERYFVGNKFLVAMAVFAGFEALFIIAVALASRAKKEIGNLTGSALVMGAVALGISFFFLCFESIGNRPATLFGYVFLVDIGLILLVILDKRIAAAGAVVGMVVFSLLASWTAFYLNSGHLYMALGLYFVFALFHSATPVVLHKVRGTGLPAWCNIFPALALVLVLMPILTMNELSIFIWPLVLLIDLLAVILAVVTTTVVPILVVLLLTLVATGAWIFRIPAELTGLSTSLFMLAGFAVFFIVAATFVCRRLTKNAASETGDSQTPQLFGAGNAANLSVQIPALSTVLPFLLLMMITVRLPLSNPSPVFGLALLLVVLLIGLAKIMSLDVLPAVGLVSVITLEHAWHLNHFNPAHAALPLAWYLVFYFVFTLYPFLFHRQFAKNTLPWATAALSGPLHFYLVLDVVRAGWPGLGGVMGLLPAAFSIPALLGVILLLKRTPVESPARNGQLAWFGGIALFFITLIFPIQFDRQWITIGWALEGAALCWLLHRVPHRGLSLAGVGLLLVAFARLALNPAVLSYHARSGTPILNWYLYAYGITTLCLFAGAYLLAPPRNTVLGGNVQPLLYGCGTVLAFLLINIEITDFFTPPGTESLTFDFSGNFLARDVSYSIAWGLFALLLLVIGIAKKLPAVRYASIGLLAVTLFKLLFHDLWQLGQLYRIASLIGVAIIAIFASFLYQRFFGAAEKSHESPIPPPVS
jgi:uncharacterized membrane protein